MLGVGVDSSRVTSVQGDAGRGFPRLIEPSWGDELTVREGVAPVSEHTAPADGGQLAGSPTATSRHWCRRTRSTRRARSSVAAIPASSRITVVPGGHGEGRPEVCRARNPARVSVRHPASVARTSAALPDGASPMTGRFWARRYRTA